MLQNLTIDDQFVDNGVFGLSLWPEGVWNRYDGSCRSNACFGRDMPDVREMWNGTFSFCSGDDFGPSEERYAVLEFTGSAVYVYGVISNHPYAYGQPNANYTFTIDGEEAQHNFIHYADNTRHRPYFLYDQLFYRNTTLFEGFHTLNIMFGVDSEIYLDYFIVTFNNKTLDWLAMPDPPPLSSSSLPLPTLSPTSSPTYLPPTSPTPSSFSDPPPTSSSPTTSSSQNSSSLPPATMIGGITGATIGGILLFLLLLCIIPPSRIALLSKLGMHKNSKPRRHSSLRTLLDIEAAVDTPLSPSKGSGSGFEFDANAYTSAGFTSKRSSLPPTQTQPQGNPTHTPQMTILTYVPPQTEVSSNDEFGSSRLSLLTHTSTATIPVPSTSSGNLPLPAEVNHPHAPYLKIIAQLSQEVRTLREIRWMQEQEIGRLMGGEKYEGKQS